MKDSHSRGRPFLGLLFGVVGWTLGCWPLTAATVTVGIYSGIYNYYFSPSSVTINVNDSVEWIWYSDYHNCDSTTGVWSTGLYNTGYTFTYMFTSAGSFPYSCTYHGFTGTIMVQGPSIIITNPPKGQVLSAPASLTLGVTATDSGGSVTNVQFFQGSTSLGNVASAPYSKAVTGLAAGSYTFSAVASDNGGLTATNSVTVSVVTPSPITVSAPRRTSTTGFQFSYAANVGLRYAVERSIDLKNWVGVNTNTPATNPVLYQDSNASAAVEYYRVMRLPNP